MNEVKTTQVNLQAIIHNETELLSVFPLIRPRMALKNGVEIDIYSNAVHVYIEYSAHAEQLLHYPFRLKSLIDLCDDTEQNDPASASAIIVDTEWRLKRGMLDSHVENYKFVNVIPEVKDMWLECEFENSGYNEVISLQVLAMHSKDVADFMRNFLGSRTGDMCPAYSLSFVTDEGLSIKVSG